MENCKALLQTIIENGENYDQPQRIKNKKS